RASITSLSASDRRSKCRVVRDLLLNALNATLSVPKKSCSTWTVAPLTQPCPDGGSGNPGVTSGAPAAGGDGSNSGSQPRSASVSGLPSLPASRIAVTGRQNLQ